MPCVHTLPRWRLTPLRSRSRVAEHKRRGRGEGGIYLLPNGKWRGTVEIGWVNGRRQRKTVTRSTRADVSKELRRLVDAAADKAASRSAVRRHSASGWTLSCAKSHRCVCGRRLSRGTAKRCDCTSSRAWADTALTVSSQHSSRRSIESKATDCQLAVCGGYTHSFADRSRSPFGGDSSRATQRSWSSRRR